MGTRITTKRTRVFVDRRLIPEQGETAEAGFAQGAVPIIRDTEKESHTYRKNFREGEGDISVIVSAGDELGVFEIALQYEGQIGQHTECLTKQGDLVQDAAQWLHEIFSEFGTDWEADWTSTPCPHGDTGLLRLGEAVRRLEGAREATRAADAQGTVTRTVTRKVKGSL